MQVIRAEAMGLCFGVRDALEIARRHPRPADVTVLGELVHNELVLEELDGRGFLSLAEGQERSGIETRSALITAHGTSQRDREELRERGLSLIDGTCPLVEKAHQAALDLEKDGRHVVVIGRRDHVEVRGLVGDLESFSVISDVEEVSVLAASRIGVICQTTTRPADAEAIIEALRAANPLADVRVVDTICSPTRDRQLAIEALLGCVDTLVVVGGANSNNTRQLARLGEERGLPAYHVQGPEDLRPEWFARSEVVGLSAGTSTLDETIDEVHRALLEIAEDRTTPLISPGPGI